MKLSEAIRLGSMIGPQAYGARRKTVKRGFLGLFGPKVEAFCAMGAAYAAVGASTVTRPARPGELAGAERGGISRYQGGELVTFITCPWYTFLERITPCPACSRDEMELDRLIAHLNDKHKWTRERIADFVETLEPKDPDVLDIRFTEHEIHVMQFTIR
jgi:hypothetical protein